MTEATIEVGHDQKRGGVTKPAEPKENERGGGCSSLLLGSSGVPSCVLLVYF